VFENLPHNVQDVMDWEWSQFDVYAQDLLARDINAETAPDFLKDYSHLASLISELYERLYVAVTVDTTDEEAEKRYNHFLEHIFPPAQEVQNQLNRKLLDSGYETAELAVPLRNIRADVAIFREENLPLMTEAQKLGTEYDKIIGAQTVEWDGEEKTLSQMRPIFQETDREKRETAWNLIHERQSQDRAALNDLWVKLLDLRVQIAKNAGFDDFRAYMWQSLHRFDYTPEDALRFFDAIEQTVVPAATRIFERRREALGLDSLRPWDLNVDVKGRDPLRPFQTVDELNAGILSIFKQVDENLGGYVQTMHDNHLLDLDNRKGKAPGGYCATFHLQKQPFIFMNAVGLHSDVQTMLHESGHAFHVFEAAHLPYFQQIDAPMEFAEVASMAMELLAGAYLEADKGGFYTAADAARARLEHLEGIIGFWPYMAVVASFQHWAYLHVDAARDAAKCDAKWLELWTRFMPGVDISGLEDWAMTGWHRKLHIFHVPFYYIEYGLAQLGAVQVWANSLADQAGALAQYRAALSLGGTATLPDLFSAAGANFALDAPTLGSTIALVEKTIAELETV